MRIKKVVNFTELALKYKSAVAVVIGLIALSGYVSVRQLPLQLLPNIQRPLRTGSEGHGSNEVPAAPGSGSCG